MNINQKTFFSNSACLVLAASVLLAGCAGPRRAARIYFNDITINDRPSRLILDTGTEQTRLLDTRVDRLDLKIATPAPKVSGHEVMMIGAVSEATRVRSG